MTTKTAPIKCHVYIVIPPFNEDEQVSRKVAASWMDLARNKLKGCHKLVPLEVGTDALSYINLDHATPNGERRRSDAAWESVIERTKATRAVDLQTKIKGKSLETTTSVFDLPAYTPVLKHPLPKASRVGLTEDQLREMKMPGWKAFLLTLVPNTMTLGFTSADLYNEYADGGEEERYVQLEERRHGLLPPILSAFGFSHIQHPDGFGTYDYDTNLYGNLSFFYLDSSFIYDPVTAPGEQPITGDEFTYDLWVLAMAPTINGEFALFWPLGTSFISLGFGPGFTSTKDSLGNDDTFVSVATRFALGHRAFVNDRWYVIGAAETMQSSPRMVHNEVFKSLNTSYAVFAVGYFFPKSRSFARRFL